MERYNYREEIKNDIIRVITEDDYYKRQEGETREEWEQRLNDDLFTCDSVTGNGSGSYTFNAWKAEENLCHNLDLLREALGEFGKNLDILEKGAEACDVTIRCYLLGECLSAALEEVCTDEEDED